MKLHTLTNGTTTIKVGADTTEGAIAKCSSPDQWQHVSTEEVPYVHEPALKAVAEALGPNWRTKPMSDEHADCNFYLVRDDGLKLFAAAPGWSHKTNWTFSFAVGGNRYLRARPKPITTSPHRDAHGIAKSIISRLLRPAEEAHAEVIAQDTAETKAKEAQDDALSELNRVLGTNYRDRFYHKNATVEVHPGGKVDIRLSGLDPAIAKCILAML